MRISGINTECRVMRAISSHQDHRGSKMRFLVVSAFLACAAAAPSHLLAPVAVAAVPAVPVAFRTVIPTLSPGDVQAAAIDAQVQAQDQAIAAVDKARALTEQATENLNDKVIVGSDLVKSSIEESFWAAQDKQWQALDALNTAEAQLDGAIASNAPAFAKSAVAGTYLAAVPISPAVYTPGIVAPVLKSADSSAEASAKPSAESSAEASAKSSAESSAQSSVEPAKEEKVEEKTEALVKSAEQIKEEKDAVTVEAAKENLDAKPQLAPLITPYAITPYGYPIVAPVGLSAVQYRAYPQIGLAPTILRNVW